MYEKTYQLKTRPFSAAPNILQYHPTDLAETALRNCRTAIERQAGPAVIFGGPGTGKTLLLDLLADSCGGSFQVVTIHCARTDTRKDLLQNILFQIGQSYRELSESELRLELADYLRPGPHCPHGLLCLVDDAHCLAEELMDELRLISGMMRGGQSRCQLVLTGNQRLEEILGSSRQESLNQKISARNYLGALTAGETSEYIRGHLRRAGGGSREFFTDNALKQVHKLSQGIPRLINQLCDSALQRCVRIGAACVSPEICIECWAEIQRLPMHGLESSSSSTFSTLEINSSTLNPGNSQDSAVIFGVEFGVLSEEEEINRTQKSEGWLERDSRFEVIDFDSTRNVVEISDLTNKDLSSGVRSSEQQNCRMLRGQLDDEACEGRIRGKMAGNQVGVEKHPEFPAFAARANSGGLGNSFNSHSECAKKTPVCDIDPDCPDAVELEQNPNRIAIPSPNPFEEIFESEEVVTEAFVRGTIVHNQEASLLTRAILDQYGVDELEARVPRNSKVPTETQQPLKLESVGDGATVPFPAGGMRTDSARQRSEAVETVQLHPANRPDDRDMLVTSRVNQVPTPPSAKQIEGELEEAVSTGRAYRMDYKQLFTRLRNSIAPGNAEPTSQG